MRAGAGRTGGLTDVVRAQLERWQDHPNTGRDARLDDVARCLSQSLTAETAEKRREKKENCLGSSRRAALLGRFTTAKVMPTYHSVVVFPSIDLPLRVHCSLQ
jgi:hypothetical protein